MTYDHLKATNLEDGTDSAFCDALDDKSGIAFLADA